MTELTLDPNFDNVDEFYARLLKAHEGLSKADSDALNARLILVLANHIGNLAILDRAIAIAKTSL
jgi:hypothetical protein